MPAAVEPPIRAELHVQTVCLAVLTVVASACALWWLQPVMIPFVVAVFLAFALMPLVDGLEVHARLPRTLAVCVALLLALLALLLVGRLVTISVNQVVSSSDQYQEQIKLKLAWVAEKLPWIESLISDIPPGGVQATLLKVTNAVWGIVSQTFLVLLFLFFLLLSSVKRDRPIGGAWGEMEARIRAYILTMTLLCGASGVVVGVVLSILGVQLAVLFGLLTFLLNFIPQVGSFVATLLPVPIVFLSKEYSLSTAIMAVAIPGTIQFIIGNFIQPKMMGDSMKLHPVVILIALIFWGMLWGIVGAFLAVPITSVIRIAFDRHPLTKPVANLMAGKLDLLREEPLMAGAVSGPE